VLTTYRDLPRIPITRVVKVVAPRATFIAVLLMAPVGLQPAAACGCFDNPPCAAVWRVDAVFIGSVVDRSSKRLAGSLSWTVNKTAAAIPTAATYEQRYTRNAALRRIQVPASAG
jgi:hypothetical protein